MLVVSCAHKIKRRYPSIHINIMDLISEGNIGLVKSADTYRGNHHTNASFCSYAIRAIDHRMMDLIKTDHLIRLPNYYLKYRSQLYKLREEYKEKLTDEMIIDKLGVTKDMLGVLKDDKNKHVIYLEDVFPSNGGNKSLWNSVLKDVDAVSPSDKITKDSLRDCLEKYISRLNAREQIIIRERHLNDSVLSYDQIGKTMKISEERARQLHFVALKKLKRLLEKDSHGKHMELELDEK